MNTILVVFIAAFTVALGSKVPVLIWSPSRSMVDIPQSYAGKTVKTSEFTNKYLSPLTSKSTDHHLVIFIQDKLSLEDFTNYADVYNTDSDGGAFKNVKGFMDEHSSVHLSSVHSPDVAVDNLIEEFQGKLQNVKSEKDLKNLDLATGQSLIIINLSPVRGAENEEEALKKNDQQIANVVQHLNKRNVKYSAIYTGQDSAKIDAESHSSHRHLLSTVEKANGTFVNQTCLYFFTRGITLFLQIKKNNYTIHTNKSDEIDGDKSTCSNDTAVLNLKLKSVNVEIELRVRKNLNFSANEWKIENATINADFQGNGTSYQGKEDITRSFMNVWAPLDFSYHCANIIFKNKHTDNSTFNATLTFHKFQFQPFNIRNNKFSDGWDCVEFFTPGIWMGIVTVGLLTIILFYGLTMIADLKTQDRFDDPKGKPMVVNVME